MLAELALTEALKLPDVESVLDIGSGDGLHAQRFRDAGKKVSTISMVAPADVIGDYNEIKLGQFDLIWASHVLEHQPNPGAFLAKCRRELKVGGWLVITVPPMKQAVVGGHVAQFNAGILLYNLIVAGFDCREAAVRSYGYNISVIVRNTPATLPALECDDGDIEKLAEFFPLPVEHGFDGRIESLNWPPRIAATDTEVVSRAVNLPVPEHVVILGLGPSLEAYLDLVKRLGGRKKFADEVWTINALGDIVQCDRVFHMDDVRIQEARAAERPRSNIAAMLEWLKTHPGPIYTSRGHADYPGLVPFPLQDVLNSCGYEYFNNTAAYAVAFAVHLGVKKISMFGCDFTYPNSHDAEKGRACVEFWLGVAGERGIELGIAEKSSLMDMVTPHTKLYGYDTLNVHIDSQPDGTAAVSFSLKDVIATAAEIEARYDHSVHPNPLVSKGR